MPRKCCTHVGFAAICAHFQAKIVRSRRLVEKVRGFCYLILAAAQTAGANGEFSPIRATFAGA